MRRILIALVGGLVAWLMVGCNSSTTPPATPDFSLQLNPASLSIDVGSNGSVGITVSPTGGFNASVALSVSGAPTDVTATVNPASTTGTSTLSVTVGASASKGTYTLTVTGTSGTLTHTATLALTVTSTAPPPPTTGSVTGTVAMLSGVPGDLNNMQCALYTGYNEWNNYSPAYTTTVTGTGASVSFAFAVVNPGSYYLDCWLDRDFNGFWSTNDLVAVYGTYVGGVANIAQLPAVLAGGVVNVALTAYYVP